MWFDSSGNFGQEKESKKPAVAAVIIKGDKFLVIDRPDGTSALPSGTGWINYDKTPEEGIKGELNYTLGVDKEDVVIEDNFQFPADPGSIVDTIEVFVVRLKNGKMRLRPKAAKNAYWVGFNDRRKIKNWALNIQK